MSATTYGLLALAEPVTDDRWFHVTYLTGCGNATSDADDGSDCMLNMTGNEILAGYDPANAPINPSPYGPVVDNG
jgi:hypothetical protein